jgi:hypothetical protein
MRGVMRGFMRGVMRGVIGTTPSKLLLQFEEDSHGGGGADQMPTADSALQLRDDILLLLGEGSRKYNVPAVMHDASCHYCKSNKTSWTSDWIRDDQQKTREAAREATLRCLTCG